MGRRLFDDLVVSRSGGSGRRRGYAIRASIGLHAMVLSAALVVPTLTPSELPEVPGHDPGPLPSIPPPVPVMMVSPPPRRAPSTTGAQRPDPPRPVDAEPAAVPIPGPPPVAPDVVPDDPDSGGPEAPCPDCIGLDEGGFDIGSTGDGSGAASPSFPIRVGEGVRPPRKLRHVPPAYPEMAKIAHVQGTVILECVIGPNGRVAGVKVLRGTPLLDAAAIEAVKQWVYTPTLLNGTPVAVVMTVTVRFILN